MATRFEVAKLLSEVENSFSAGALTSSVRANGKAVADTGALNRDYTLVMGVVIFYGVLIILFGIYLTGIIHIPALSRERKKHLTSKPLGIFGSVLVGITFAAGWTPCIGPILASILIYASTAKTVTTGVVLLSVYPRSP